MKPSSTSIQSEDHTTLTSFCPSWTSCPACFAKAITLFLPLHCTFDPNKVPRPPFEIEPKVGRYQHRLKCTSYHWICSSNFKVKYSYKRFKVKYERFAFEFKAPFAFEFKVELNSKIETQIRTLSEGQ